MKIEEKAAKVIKLIEKQIQELDSIFERYVKKIEDGTIIWERVRRWKYESTTVIAQEISHLEAARFERTRGASFDLTPSVRRYHAFLGSLIETIQKDPEKVLGLKSESSQNEKEESTPSGEIFIVHGHDEVNLRRLVEMLRDRWNLRPLVLSNEPERGRTLIEKFEEEAQRATYAIAILTPDDQIKISDTEYLQGRPNAIFELGWFYGCLGRERVCILFKRGTKIHSDLDGIMRIQFNEYVNERKKKRDVVENCYFSGEMWGGSHLHLPVKP